MIESSGILKDVGNQEIKEWHSFFKYEEEKRKSYLDMLKKIREFWLLYLGNSGLTDWPNNRINVCLPEILLFFYSLIAQLWNDSQYSEHLGGVTVYPVGRMGKVNDAILNFSELRDKNSFTLNGLISSKNAFYFEFNEDFNLHLKCEANAEMDKKIDAIHAFMHDNNTELSLSEKYNTTPERYKQGNYVFYEWDLMVLDNIDDLSLILPKTSEVISNAITIIK